MDTIELSKILSRNRDIYKKWKEEHISKEETIVSRNIRTGSGKLKFR